VTAVSFVIPVLNGRRYLRRVLTAIAREARGRPAEIIVVDDGSTDGSRRIAESFRVKADATRFESDCRGLSGSRGFRVQAEVRVINGPRRGAAAAMNAGIHEARYPVICQVDQDVIVQPGWLEPLLGALEDPAVAAAQGRYVVPRSARFWSCMAGRDLDLRYAQLPATTDHVCTGNTAYRASTLDQVGLFDETFGYGYDNDLSYRLVERGHRLSFCRTATAEHYWRDSLAGFCAQQFGVGYGRIDVVRLHPGRVTGDAVSRSRMMLHAPLTFAALVLTILSSVAAPFGIAAGVVFASLAAERTVAGIRAWRLTSDRRTLLFPLAHLIRDLVWVWAIVLWIARRLIRLQRHPSHSMRRPRTTAPVPAAEGPVLVLVPAYNEAANLPGVVSDLRTGFPDARVLIINDASVDETGDILPALGVEWLTLPQRLGVGGALRAGLRWSRRHGFRIVARVDGDGQHRARDLARLLKPIAAGEADAVAGSRYLRGTHRPTARRMTQRLLAMCLSAIARQRITDPTSGLWMLGPRAVQLLGDRHPGGYPEPEIHLLLARHGLVVREVAVHARERLAGRTSLTPARAAVAFARTAFAFMALTLRPDREPGP
jgi:glycosyltransferase involved in cell wall biosynthesis